MDSKVKEIASYLRDNVVLKPWKVRPINSDEFEIMAQMILEIIEEEDIKRQEEYYEKNTCMGHPF